MSTAKTPLRIGIPGCGGRMGRLLIKATLQTPDVELAGGTCRADSEVRDQDLGSLAGMPPIGATASTDREGVFRESDAVIDFTSASALPEHLGWAVAHRCALVLGTSGLSAKDRADLAEAAKHIPIVDAPNTSLGVTVLAGLVRQVSALLGPEFDIEIVEMHHRNKKDAPSGTALHLGRSAAAGRGVTFDEVATLSREGDVGARPKGAIGFAPLRGGGVVAEHSVVFAGDSERLELSHRAEDRMVFADGAVRAALWLSDQPPGLYGMEDVLGLSSILVGART